MIEYGRYKLRNSRQDDVPTLAKWWNNGEIMSYFGYPLGMGVNENDVKTELEKDAIKRYHRLIIEDDGMAVGETYYQHLDNQTAKIGIRICNPILHNRGMGRIILSMLISFLFDEMNYKFVTVTTNFTNERARHVYEKLGFKQHALEMNKEKDQLGNPQIFVVYKMTKESFVSFLINL